MIERFKIFPPTTSHQPLSESQILWWLLNIVTQQCSYKRTDPLTCFVQLFIARFSSALFSLILSHTDKYTSRMCTCVCVCVRVLVSHAAWSPMALHAVLSYNIYWCLLKKPFGLTPKYLSLSLPFFLPLLCISIPKDFCKAEGHGRFSSSSLGFHCL